LKSRGQPHFTLGVRVPPAGTYFHLTREALFQRPAMDTFDPPTRHGSSDLRAVIVDDYNIELRDAEGFLGDRANKSAFKSIVDNWRDRLRKINGDPLDEIATTELYKNKRSLERILLGGKVEAAGLLLGAIEDFSRQLCVVLHRVLDLGKWQSTQRLVIGGGFREGRLGELVIGRVAVLLKASGREVALTPVRYHPDEAGLIGSIHLAPHRAIRDFQGMLAVDIGGTNIRAGVVEFGPGRDLGKARVRRSVQWRHADECPDREQAVDRLVSMLRTLRSSEDSDFRLAPFVGIACPGVIRQDGSIERGGQNLPGDWDSPDFNLVRRIEGAIDGACVLMHNDAVVQGLSELPFMRDVNTWGAVTIGTGLGNALYRNRT
jgi:ROK family